MGIYMNIQYECQYCGKQLSTKWNCKRHEATCEKNQSVDKRGDADSVDRCVKRTCQFCGKSCKNNKSLSSHERLCPSNPNRHYVSYTIGHAAWNKGLTKLLDDRIKHYGETYSRRVAAGEIIVSMTGKRHTEETKQRMSESHKKWWINGDSIFATAREHRTSYPEEYFAGIFVSATRHYHVSRYFLDFAWPNKKLYVEVDGEQHYTDKGMRHDSIRTDILSELGWVCVERIRWKTFSKLSFDERRAYINNIVQKVTEYK